MKGNRITGFADGFASKHFDNAALQQYITVKACAAAKLPSSVSFEEGAILPVSIATAAVDIFLAMDIPRPPASSSVGTAAVQIAFSLGYTVYGVCSPRHSAYV